MHLQLLDGHKRALNTKSEILKNYQKNEVVQTYKQDSDGEWYINR